MMSAPVAIGTVIAERYRVDRVIGEGGMGVVCLAEHLILQQRVAIKFLRHEAMRDAGAVERFVREARAAAKVQSEHVVRVHDVAALEDGTPYIVMEYVEGRDLSAVMEERGMLTVGDAVAFALQACEALAETHAAGIVHGDLKPDNLYIATSADGRQENVKLLDFGISRISREDSGADLIVGTPAYMAPEQFAGHGINVLTDIWALGAVFYEMLAGAPPFGADEPDAIRARVLADPLPVMSRQDVPEQLNNLLQRCLQKDPAHRFTNITDIAKELEPWLVHESSLQRIVRVESRAQPTPTHQRSAPTMLLPDRRRRRRLWLVIPALAALGLVVVGFVVALGGGKPHDASAKAAGSASVTLASAAPSVAPSAALAPTNDSAVPARPAITPAVSVAVSAKGSPTTPPRARATRSSAPEPRRSPDPPSAPAEGDRFGTRK